MKAKQLFEEVLPRMLSEKPERVRELSGTITFVLHGAGGGSWTVDPHAKPPRVVAGSMRGECTLTAETADFEAILENPQAALRLYQQGKFLVEGDTTLASNFHRLFA